MSKASRKRRNQKLRNKNNTTIQKDTRQQRSANKSIATPAIQSIKQIVELLKPYELSQSQRFRTYQLMIADEAVWSALESRMSSIETAQHRYRLKFDKNSERSVWLKDFIEYNIRRMKRTPRAIAAERAEMIYNGISPHEIVTRYEKESSEYNGYFVLDDLTYIDPLTVDPIKPFETKNGGRELKVWRQRRDAFKDTTGRYGKSVIGAGLTGVIEIDARKVTSVSYAATSGRPLGRSPLDAAYSPWREKNLIQDYLVMGIQKDLAGTPVLEVPAELLEKAKDPESQEAKVVEQLQYQMSNLHAGDQSFMILPSDPYEGAGNSKMFNAKFLGIEGTGKNFNLVEIIEQKKKAIFNVLGASHLITGENGGGSYNLHEGKASIQAHYSKRDNIIIDDSWNKDIIPYILKLNGLTNEKISDIPVYEHGEVQPLSADETSKALQRMGAVGLLPKQDPVFLNETYRSFGWHYQFDEDISQEELLEKLGGGEVTTRAGDGMTEGMSNGTGDSLGNNSATNSENAA